MRLALLLLAGCAMDSPPPDVTGPFTGEVHTYYVDGFTLPAHTSEARALADDLDGDRSPDNTLGAMISSLAALGHDLTANGPDMIAAGVIRSSFEIQADDLDHDETVGARYIGEPGDPDAVVVGGTLRAGVFRSNRTLGGHALGATTLHVPVMVDADPSVFELQRMEIDLTPDGDGGYDGIARGYAGPEIVQIAAAGLAHMIAANPHDHAELIALLDTARTGDLSAAAIAASITLQNLLPPDSGDGAGLRSFGFGFHLSPMPTGGAPADACHDRIKDGDETDVDCGGSCSLDCAGGATCTTQFDCQSAACNTTCAPVTCSDGVRDGIETDVDCGGWECGACESGRDCTADTDCTTGKCEPGGTCL